jgi:hypothetical protein
MCYRPARLASGGLGARACCPTLLVTPEDVAPNRRPTVWCLNYRGRLARAPTDLGGRRVAELVAPTLFGAAKSWGGGANIVVSPSRCSTAQAAGRSTGRISPSQRRTTSPGSTSHGPGGLGRASLSPPATNARATPTRRIDTVTEPRSLANSGSPRPPRPESRPRKQDDREPRP